MKGEKKTGLGIGGGGGDKSRNRWSIVVTYWQNWPSKLETQRHHWKTVMKSEQTRRGHAASVGRNSVTAYRLLLLGNVVLKWQNWQSAVRLSSISTTYVLLTQFLPVTIFRFIVSKTNSPNRTSSVVGMDGLLVWRPRNLHSILDNIKIFPSTTSWLLGRAPRIQ